MGYLFLGISLLAGATKGFCGKTVSGKVTSMKGTFYVNVLRMILCVIIGFFVVMSEDLSSLKADMKTIVITGLSGASTAVFVASWIMSVRKGAYVMLDVFLMLGVGVTVALCRAFFSENIELNQYIGYFMLMASAYILCSYSSKLKGKLSLKNLAVLIICGVSNGLADFSQKWFIHTVPNGSVGVFNFYTYIFSAVILIILFLIENRFEKVENDGKSLKVFLIICLMAVCLFANSYFKTMAAKYIDSATLYPLSTGVALILSVLMAAVFFKERVTAKSIFGVLLAFASLVIMNL